MNIIKAFLLLITFFTIIFPYSDNCGSPLIRAFSINTTSSTSDLSRSNEIGSISFFSVRNLSTNLLEEIEFELLISDGQTNFYGEIAEIYNGNIDITIVNELFQTFTLVTLGADSLDLQKGIRAAEESILGLPPIINGNSEVHILLMDIRDGYSSSGEFVAGFFDPNDQYLCWEYNSILEVWRPNYIQQDDCESPYQWATASNGLNIIYIDSNPSIINVDGLENTLFTLAHEYQHLLHWNSDMKEGYFGSSDGGWTFHNPWLNEGISDLMPSILGLGMRDFTPFLEYPTIGLDDWSQIGSDLTLPYYAKSALFFQFLYELEGMGIVTSIFKDNAQGLESIKSQFDNKGFETLYVNWIQSLAMGKLEITLLDQDIDSENIENYISIDLQNITIEPEKNLTEYSFMLFSVPEYLTITNAESNSELSILLYSDNAFFDSEDIVHNGINNIETIIAYTRNFEIENLMVDISYNYISSPKKDNLFIYPNPITEGVFSYVYFGDGENGGMALELFDLNGRNVLIAESIGDNYGNHSGEMDVKLSSGIYILKSRLDSGVTESRFISIIK